MRTVAAVYENGLSNDLSSQELARTAELRAMVARFAEACFLLRTLGEHNVGRLAARLDDATRERVRRLTLRQLAVDPEGDSLASQLISALITEHLASTVRC